MINNRLKSTANAIPRALLAGAIAFDFLSASDLLKALLATRSRFL
jgi:uncharacterized membrane protein